MTADGDVDRLEGSGSGGGVSGSHQIVRRSFGADGKDVRCEDTFVSTKIDERSNDRELGRGDGVADVLGGGSGGGWRRRDERVGGGGSGPDSERVEKNREDSRERERRRRDPISEGGEPAGSEARVETNFQSVSVNSNIYY